jgi:hypothetical protein
MFYLFVSSLQSYFVNSLTNRYMGLFKDEGDAALALAEECAEVIQIITKLKRFGGNWNEIPPGKDVTRLQMLESEMSDLMHQWNRLQLELYAMSE